MTKTQNYNLNKPEAGDPMRVADFNVNSDIIDAALKNLSAERVYVGSYVGDGTNSRTIELPWAPAFAVIMGQINNSATFNVAIPEFTFYSTGDVWGGGTIFNILLQGNTLVIQNRDWNNAADVTVRYILVR